MGLSSKGAVTGRVGEGDRRGRIEFKVKKRHARNGWKGKVGNERIEGG